MKSLQDVFRLIFENLPQEQRLRFRMARMAEQWEQVVGPEIARQSRPVNLLKQTLVLEVTNPVWKTELQFLKNDILAKVNEHWDFNIKDIRIE